MLNINQKTMSRNNLILGAVAGVAAAALIRNYLQTESGKQMVRSASEGLKDLSSRATEYAKQSLSQIKGGHQHETVQPS